MFIHPTPALVGWNHPATLAPAGKKPTREQLLKILRELPLPALRDIERKAREILARRKAKAPKAKRGK